ncbi:MAG: DUF120 domain-containing protein [Ignisphaera sp.]
MSVLFAVHKYDDDLSSCFMGSNMLCAELYHIIRGKVVDGVGEGSKYVSLYQEVLTRILGIVPYPGTLNIKLSVEEAQKVKQILQKSICIYFITPPGNAYCKAYAWKAYVRARGKCIRAYIVKPEKTIYGDDVVELLSEVYLRGALDLRTGDEIELLITSNCLNPCGCP